MEKRIRVSPCILAGGRASSGIKASQFFLMIVSAFLTYGPKSTPCVSVRISTPLDKAVGFVSFFADGEDVAALARVLWPTKSEELKNRPATASTATANPMRAFTIEPFIERLRDLHSDLHKDNAKQPRLLIRLYPCHRCKSVL